MCGLVGAFSRNPSFSREQVQRAVQAIAHRGPDHQGVYLSPSQRVVLGHARLSILDPSPSGHQPMAIDGAVIAYNGEIYNHLDLRALSEHEFKSTSDTETLLRGLSASGSDFLSSCLGMFAGAFFDESTEALVLFRDSLGIKNLYYHHNADGIVFASEIKAILALMPDLKLSLSKSVLSEYLCFENYRQGTSLFSEIKALAPGDVMRIDQELNIVVTKYSSPTTKIPEGDPVVVGRAQLQESVDRHLLSDFPVGVYLSGGIDSSLVAAMAKRKVNDIVAFTGYFSTVDSYYDERPLAKLVAEKLAIPLREVEITPTDFVEYFDELIFHIESPKMGMGAFSQYVVAKFAAKERRVILAGHGGDELFAGYPMFKAFWVIDSGFRKMSIKAKEWIWILFHAMNHYVFGRTYFAPKIFKDARCGRGTFWIDVKTGSLEALSEYYQATYIPGLLEVEDKISMAHSLETRVPFWDVKMLKFARSVPMTRKLKNGVLKALLKEIARPLLPDEVLNGPKRGFPTPLRLWFKNELFDYVGERLGRDSPTMDVAMSFRRRMNLLKRHRYVPLPFAFDEIRAHKIWMLLCLESMERQFGVTVEH